MLEEMAPGETKDLWQGSGPGWEEGVEQLQADLKTCRWEVTGVFQEQYGCLSCCC